ncbi:MAG: RAMP superfamily CRISPR-associated protein [Pseudomonadota bacterium]
MLFRGQLIAETPIYRGNARKSMFTRDGDGTQRLVSLAGEISGTAQSLMDAFIGQSRDGKNIGLLNRLWLRLYGSPMPNFLIASVQCELQAACYPRDHFFDLRMGIRLDEDRWAAEANANFKMETIFRHAVFDFALSANDTTLRDKENAARFYYLLQELVAGRFWFGMGKSAGLGRVRLELEAPLPAPAQPPALLPGVNHLRMALTFNAENPVLVGWNWGKVDPTVPAFAAVEGRLLIASLREIPEAIRERLTMVMGGPILNPEDWKRKLTEHLPRLTAIWLQGRSSGNAEIWVLNSVALAKLGKGKFPLSKKIIDTVQPLCTQSFASQAVAEAAIGEALGDKAANMAKRILGAMERRRQTTTQLNHEDWLTLAAALDLAPALEEPLAASLGDEAATTQLLAAACGSILSRLTQQIDQQIDLLQSDPWVDGEITTREEHLLIKTMLLDGRINEVQWNDSRQPPQGVSASSWQTFLGEHSRVRYNHMTHAGNLRKSITNDRNFIDFLTSHRARARQELGQPQHIDFRSGGSSNRTVSRQYGKPYDHIFMRLLTWKPSTREHGTWEVYVPGTTLKGAFRKRASQILKTLWGETPRTSQALDHLFGAQGKRGAVMFSDAYLMNPEDPRQTWCSMDGVKMDPQTGQPQEKAKQDYLYAYGKQMVFQWRMDMQDIAESDLETFSLLAHLLEDFQRGDIPLGGNKSNGFGWVEGTIAELEWLTASPVGVTQKLFGKHALTPAGVWHRLGLVGPEAVTALRASMPLAARVSSQTPPKSRSGFISHRAFGGYSGTLVLEAEVLTPLHIKESGEPTAQRDLGEGRVNGWDFFSMTPPEAAERPAVKTYALPSRSIRGMLRHIYTIASDSAQSSGDITHLNPADSLFGWVGTGPNQALMGRLSFGFGLFDAPQLSWFAVPYPYTGWAFEGGKWGHKAGRAVPRTMVGSKWRLFQHAPLAPTATRMAVFQPTTVQASYFQAILPGSKARFTLRFWNLEEVEFRRLIWSIILEPGLAHKIGHHRHLGFGSLRLRILPESHLIDWAKRYSQAEWRIPIRVEDWRKGALVAHAPDLKKALNVQSI